MDTAVEACSIILRFLAYSLSSWELSVVVRHSSTSLSPQSHNVLGLSFWGWRYSEKALPCGSIRITTALVHMSGRRVATEVQNTVEGREGSILPRDWCNRKKGLKGGIEKSVREKGWGTREQWEGEGHHRGTIGSTTRAMHTHIQQCPELLWPWGHAPVSPAKTTQQFCRNYNRVLRLLFSFWLAREHHVLTLDIPLLRLYVLQ